MPYSAANKWKDNAHKRAWNLRQKQNNTAYWQRHKKRISKRKAQKSRDLLKPKYIKALLGWPEAPAEIIELKRLQIKLLRASRIDKRYQNENDKRHC
jgi:hypothetical protein